MERVMRASGPRVPGVIAASLVVLTFACDSPGPSGPSRDAQVRDGVPAGGISPHGPEVLSAHGVGPETQAATGPMSLIPSMMPPVTAISLGWPALIWQDTTNGLRSIWEM